MRLVPITKNVLKTIVKIYPVQTSAARQCRMRYLITAEEYSCIAECAKTCELKENCAYVDNIGYFMK